MSWKGTVLRHSYEPPREQTGAPVVRQELNQRSSVHEESDEEAGLELMAIVFARWAHQRERCQAIHPKIVADYT
ncbi:hypothetical protein N7536_000822 [Penicillium majusculum]|nr:hypothetical protein N7536_000822 [Penicillium majusculum]